ncbi:MAG: outer membrane protein assembly factor BamD [Fibrobacteres bacterium]|nr:outer membrane protein assembly factor BamD [Fibrobacterota bacterium]
MRLLLTAIIASILILSSCSPRTVAVEPTVTERLTAAKERFNNKRYYDARQAFESLRFDYPGDEVMGEVQYYIGLCHYHMKDYMMAEHEIRYFQRDFGETHELYDDAAYWLCKSMFMQALPAKLDQTITLKAVDECTIFLEQLKNSEYAGEVVNIRKDCLERLAEKEFLAGRQYRRMGYASSAIHYFRTIEQEYPTSRWVAAVRFEWAYSLYDQKNYSDALAMADSCSSVLKSIEESSSAAFVRTKPYSVPYKLVHLFGLVPYEKRSELGIYVDDLKKNVANLVKKIKKKQAKA